MAKSREQKVRWVMGCVENYEKSIADCDKRWKEYGDEWFRKQGQENYRMIQSLREHLYKFHINAEAGEALIYDPELDEYFVRKLRKTSHPHQWEVTIRGRRKRVELWQHGYFGSIHKVVEPVGAEV